ncbi:MAG TPA: metallophosphoesterase [Methanobacterium sp.]|nr:metallophosphoesterase [Methanobacterium sp.]
MSDSHDNLKAIKKAVKYFNSQNVDLVLHAGDLISPFTAQEFLKLKSPLLAVYGNNDGEREGLRQAYQNICYLEDFKEISIENRQIALIHGANPAIVDALSRSDKYDMVIRGHSHQMSVKNDETLTINPGEVCGYLTGDKTVILMDPEDLSYEVKFL